MFRLIRARDEYCIVREDEHGRIAIAYRHEDRALCEQVFKLVDEAYERGMVLGLLDWKPRKPPIYGMGSWHGNTVCRDGTHIITAPTHQDAIRVLLACRYALTIGALSVLQSSASSLTCQLNAQPP